MAKTAKRAREASLLFPSKKQAHAEPRSTPKLSSAPPHSDLELSASEREAQLRAFDHELKYGPSVGVTRLERWERAERFGLRPPSHIPELLRTDGVPLASVFERLMRERAE
ncbi:hypothetical protein KFE25_010606 [Diacronema lutheri]|uniref:DNA polymerase delta subunit 4 n=2 Tax=Diacronema lutheri TaxID=2081491 RepID=A0A8J5XIT2_DIALT|nr:hypothetical protein KFE25_010606 [Diacronema lutheri]